MRRADWDTGATGPIASGDGGGSGIGRPTGYNVDLAFTLEDEPDTQRRRRLVLIAEALKAIANADARLLTWNFVEPAADRWVHLRLVLTTTWPGKLRL